MIIRLTLNDNDFTEQLEMFANKLYFMTTCNPRDFSSQAYDDVHEFNHLWCELLNGSGKLNDEQHARFYELILKKFEYYVESSVKEDSKEYFRKNINIRLQKSLTPRNENGEVVYVIVPAGGAIITL